MENKIVMSEEQATKEVYAWLDYKKVSEKKRLSLAGNIRSLIEGIMDGTLVINSETLVITQTLRFAISGKNTLEYKPRVAMKDLQTQLLNVKATDSMGTSFAYISALTGQPQSVVKEMDQEDFTIADHLSVFFMM